MGSKITKEIVNSHAASSDEEYLQALAKLMTQEEYEEFLDNL